MSYSFKGRVRYSEIGENGCLTLPGIQDYYQDCCTFQSESIGQGMEVLENRLTDEDTRGYVLDEKLDMDYAPRKIALPENMTAEEPFAIQKHHLDTHHHVNNCQYIRMAADYLPEGFVIRQMRAEYKKQALLGDIFYPSVKQETGKVTVALSTEGGEPYAVVEFTEA